MKVEFDYFSGVGPRETNDDRLLLPTGAESQKIMVAIADGIGGAAGGGEAAALAVDEVKKASANPERLPEIFQNVIEQLKSRSEADTSLSKMGTTLSVALICEGQIHVAHVGDTRIYHLRRRGLNTLTQDQTEIAELIRKGIIRPGQARRYPRRNVLMSALTVNARYQLHLHSTSLKLGDRVVLTSDGVHERVMRQSMLNVSLKNQKIEDFVQEMEKKVIETTPVDNYSLLGLEICEI